MSGRLPKIGADYFSKDIDFYEDDKVRLLRAEFGAKGMYLLDYLLCDIYKQYGYYAIWDKRKCFLVSDGAGCGCTPEFVAEFVAGCIRCSFFNKRVFDMFGVLTSAGIQRRFMRVLKNRDNFYVISEYFLLDVDDKRDVPEGILNKLIFKNISPSENEEKSSGNKEKHSENTQSIVPDSNLPKSKKGRSPASPSFDSIIDSYTDNEELRFVLKEHLKTRKAKSKAALTNYAIELSLKTLDKLATDDNGKIQIVKKSIERGWVGFFAEKKDDTPIKAGPLNNFHQDSPDFDAITKTIIERQMGNG